MDKDEVHFQETVWEECPSRNVRTDIDIQGLIFDPIIFDQIVEYTNHMELPKAKTGSNKRNKQPRHNGAGRINFFSASMKNNHLNAHLRFDPNLCRSIYRSVISVKRFQFLSSSPRFDKRATSPICIVADPFAPIRDVWNQFILNFNQNYKSNYRCSASRIPRSISV